MFAIGHERVGETDLPKRRTMQSPRVSGAGAAASRPRGLRCRSWWSA